ncbi:MAG: YfhO family protein [Bacilli bacterium]|nr:YfhO family protein [Bacilli bacterium]
MKNILKKTIPYIINMLIITCIFLLTLKINNIYPLGNINFDIYDATVQYKPMLYNFIMGIKTGTIESYSFITGLGAPTMFDFLYYYSSPLNLFAIFFKSAEAMFFSVTLLKIIITSIVCTFYFNKTTKNNFITTICTIGYIFSGWFLAYYFSIMWLDIFMIFPLFKYGLDKLINENKINTYIFTLAYIIICNFYIAYMVCIFTLIYFIVKIISKRKELNKKLIIRKFQIIFVCTIITFLLSFFHIYALYDSFLKQGIEILHITKNEMEISFISVINSLFYGNIVVNTDSYTPTFPNICTNMLFTISLLYYFINNKINIKEKIKNMIMIIIVLAAVLSPHIDYFLNCFHVTIGFSFRYSFIISFFMILLFIKNYKTFEKKIDKKIYIILLIILIYLLTQYKVLDKNIFILNISTLISYTLFFIFYNKNKFYKYILLFIIIIESFITSTFNIKNDYTVTTEENWTTTHTKYRSTLDQSEYFNNNFYTNTKVINQFSSMLYKNTLSSLTNIGINTNGYNSINYTTEIENYAAEMMLNIKNDNFYLEKIFAVNNDILYLDLAPSNTIQNIENLINTTTGISDIFIKETKKPDEITDDFYIYNFDKKTPCIMEIQFEDYNSYLSQVFLSFEIAKEYNSKEYVNLYTQNTEKLKEAHNYLKKNQVEYEYYSDSHIKGTINVNENQIIYTSIPYDKSWEIKIDGQEVKATKLLDSLIGIEVEPGKHTIEMKYKYNYTPMAIISTCTLIGLLANIIYQNKKKKIN